MRPETFVPAAVVLANCPHCGPGSVKTVFAVVTNGIRFQVRCGCGAMGPKVMTREEARAAWARRPAEEKLRAELQRVHEAYGSSITCVLPPRGGD